MRVRSGKGIEQIAFAVFSLAVSYAVSYFTRPKVKTNIRQPDLTPGTASTRGASIPLLMGRRLVEPIVLLLADPTAIPQYNSVRSKGSKKKQQLTGYQYREKAVHALAVGPGSALYEIRQAGEVIYSGEINRQFVVSGASFNATDGSTFRVYWGDENQPVDPVVAQHGELPTRYPGLMYIVWDTKVKGSSPQWLELKYDIWGLGYDGQDFGAAYNRITASGGETGVSPAYLVWVALTAERPWGAGIDPSLIDKTSLDQWASDAATEELPVNMLLGEGDTAGTVLQALGRDHGYFFRQLGSRLTFKPLRKPTGSVAQADSTRVRGRPRPKRAGREGSPNRRIFAFPDRLNRFTRNTVEIVSNGVAARLGGFVDTEDQIDTAIDKEIASKVASIRATYSRQIDNEVRFKGFRDFENLRPGDLVDLPNGRRIRIGNMLLDPVVGEVDIEGVEGLMTELVITSVSSDEGGQVVLDVEVDPRVAIVDLTTINDDEAAIGVLRLRAHEQISQTELYLSADGGAYTLVQSDTPPALGGDLDTGESIPSIPSTWAATTAYVLNDIVVPTDPRDSLGLQMRCTTAGTSAGTEPTWATAQAATTNDGSAVWTAEAVDTGPVFRPESPDYTQAQDLTGDDVAWANEAQYAIFTDGSVVSLQRIAAVAATDRADSTVYATNSEIIPLGVTTGLVYVNEGASGTSSATEPAAILWRVREGETVTDGTVTWTARYPRYTLEGIRWTGEDYPIDNLTADVGVYIIPNELVSPLVDPRVVLGTAVAAKTVPTANGDVVAIGDVSPVSLTPTT